MSAPTPSQPSDATPPSVAPLNFDLSTPLMTATSYTKLGWKAIPVPYKSKKPVIKGWTELSLGLSDLADHFGDGPMNIGCRLGTSSGGLSDADMDCPQAVLLAPLLLPKTHCTFGRTSKRASHHLYIVTDNVPTRVLWRKPKSLCAEGDKGVLVELRGTGHQTVFPGSVHESGEPITFDECFEPARVSRDELETACGRVAAASVLAQYWPNGSRWEAAMALAGGLLRSGWKEDQVVPFIEAVCLAAHDEETRKRCRDAAATAAKYAAGEPVTGWPTLAKLVGEDVVELAIDWLGIAAARRLAFVEGTPIPYRSTAGGLIFEKPTAAGPVPVRLTNFTAEILADIAVDDGAEVTRIFEIEASLSSQAPIRFPVTVDEFLLMRWPIKALGSGAVVFPGHNAEAHTKTAIMLLSPRALRRTRYGHTGWRKIGNEWVFLHAGGAITAAGLIDEVETELSGGLELFRLLAPPVGEELVTPIHATLNLLALGRAKLMFPLIAAVFRAILGDADFYLFLVGTTGLFKSEAAALAQQHFGPGLDSRHLPGSWTSTANALEDLAFRAKDALLVVDDFKPSGDTFADAKLHQQADRLLRAQGNGSARQRMRADCSLRAPRPPRGLMLCTGEDVPHGESLRARGLVLQVAPGDIEITRLTRCQQDAAAGLYPQVSSAFCRWAASRLPALKKELRERAASLRPKFAGAHSRSPGMLAELFVSFEIFLRFAVETTQEGALTKDEGKELLATCEGALKQAGAEHSALLKVSEPTGRYLSLLSAALASGAAHLADKDGNAPRSAGACGWRLEYSGTLSSYKAMGTRIGWVEGPDVYLEAEAAYQVAQEHAVKGGGVAVTEQALRKRLRDKGLLVSTDASRNTLTIRKTFNGGRQNVLHLRAADLGISETPDEPDHSNIPV